LHESVSAQDLVDTGHLVPLVAPPRQRGRLHVGEEQLGILLGLDRAALECLRALVGEVILNVL